MCYVVYSIYAHININESSSSKYICKACQPYSKTVDVKVGESYTQYSLTFSRGRYFTVLPNNYSAQKEFFADKIYVVKSSSIHALLLL